MDYIRIIDGVPAPYNIYALRADNPQVSFPETPSAECLAEFEVYQYEPVEPPTVSPIERAESQFVLIDGVWTQQWEIAPIPIDDARAVLASAVDRIRDSTFAAGFTVPDGPLEGKTLQTRDDTDKINWLTSQAAYSAAIAAGAGSVEGATFRTAENETISMSYSDGLDVLMAMAAWGKDVWGNSWALKDEIAAAENHDALASIDLEAGWP